MKTLLLFILFINNSYGESIDVDLSKYTAQFRINALDRPKGFNQERFNLGQKLFFEKAVSGNNNISCASCHGPSMGTGDNLPLSLGAGAIGIGTSRVGTRTQIISRNAPPLYNLSDKSFMFWDGRVSWDTFEFKTPEAGLNGERPLLSHITNALDSALSAQALFPPTSHAEMRGHDNELAAALTNAEVWKLIMKRLLSKQIYRDMFVKAFPASAEFNIGHFGSALGHYQGHAFAVTNTPWDKYLRGDLAAISLKQKKGAEVFFTTGRCVVCHSGSSLGGSSFRNIAAPQIGPGVDIQKNDEGRFLVTGNRRDLYRFKTPMLRNISKTAPYFHSGAYKTIESVIEHYASGTRALDQFNSDWLRPYEVTNYDGPLFVETDRYKLFKKKENAHPLMRNHMIRLTDMEKDQLKEFLEISLTQE
jgi:cytochrome c peroxidase